MKNSQLHFYDYSEHTYNLLEDVLEGLNKKPKELHPKLFYDTKGSELFDKICELPEYYITRVETDIMQNNAKDIAKTIGAECLFLELGSGNCRKVRFLLPHFSKVSYMPMDISKEQLLQSSYSLLHEFPHINIHAVCLDYSRAILIPEQVNNMRRVVYFPGSSISNFEAVDIKRFLKMIAALVQPHGGLVIGVDLKKDIGMLNAAYNDTQGVTAAFNRNILERINKELKANFQVNNFKHQAFYNEAVGRIEMHLISTEEQQVVIEGNILDFQTSESIHTENSYKFYIEEFQQLAYDAGFQTAKLWVDKDKLFSVHYFGFEHIC
ncbi:L-histidine N(alpha)-methyltransferase [soil metagenome]